ncbi:MAG: shikimate dehydrogenase family protein [Acidimicrobiia bacterium]
MSPRPGVGQGPHAPEEWGAGAPRGINEAPDILVNATPVGMNGTDVPVDPRLFRPGQAVVDLIYHPAETPLLAGARRAGAQAHNGLGMLVHQAAASFTLWTGVAAPVEAMLAAARSAIPS